VGQQSNEDADSPMMDAPARRSYASRRGRRGYRVGLEMTVSSALERRDPWVARISRVTVGALGVAILDLLKPHLS